MMDRKQKNLPEFFAWLIERGCFQEASVYRTSDGFYAVTATVADVLAHRGITTVPGSQGDPLDCSLFFDDWYFYAVSDGGNDTYSLFKMREQEHDAQQGQKADGDTPGVTVSFVPLRADLLLACLKDPSTQNRIVLNAEIDRVVASRGQRHSNIQKKYFARTRSEGAYLIAKLYTGYIASLSKDGCLPVPERYASVYQTQKTVGRLTAFLEENNRSAGAVICDHKNIYICDPIHPTKWERLAILATHTGNTSFFSFAAEVQYHAKFLTWWTRIPLPIIGRSPYDSAIRADMSIGDGEFTGPTPYYRTNSLIVKAQYDHHKDTDWITDA